MKPAPRLTQVTEYEFRTEKLLTRKDGAGAQSSDSAIPPEEKVLRVKISQLVDAEFGGFLWPSSHPLAWWIWQHASMVAGKRVLEVSFELMFSAFSLEIESTRLTTPFGVSLEQAQAFQEL